MTASLLQLDFETRSTLDLKEVGVFRYAEHPTTDVWCMSYAIDEGPVKRWRPGQPEPLDFIKHKGLFVAWNAQFESTIHAHVLSTRYGWKRIPAYNWLCSAALAARAALPRSLEYCAEVMGLAVSKDKEGHALMKRMMRPRRIEADGTIVWWDDPEMIERLAAYCDQDVIVQRAIHGVLPAVGSDFERRAWLLDQEINARGVRLDVPFATAALRIADQASDVVDAEIRETTDGAVTRITQVQRLKEWLDEQGVDVDSLDKEAIRDLLDSVELPGMARRAIELRALGNKSSVAKLATMLDSVCDDGYLRDLLLYFGASTGRWAGRRVQPQNFPRGSVDDVERYFPLIATGDYELLSALVPEPALEIIASALRGCFIASEGHDYVVADFAAIEARVLAWLAGAQKLLQSFARGESPYPAMGVPVFGHECPKSGDVAEYTICKSAVLGAGYQMGAETFLKQTKKQAGVTMEPELAEKVIAAYRSLHWEIPELWCSMNATAMHVVENNIEDWVPVEATGDKLHFGMDDGWLRMLLPSGRSLWYARARIIQRETPWSRKARQEAEEKGEDAPEPEYRKAVGFEGVNPKTRQWGLLALYGGLLTENAVQAISRDLMVEAMFRVEDAGYKTVLTVHDEIVTEAPEDQGSVAEFEALMSAVPEWASGCPVAAEGWRGKRYRK